MLNSTPCVILEGSGRIADVIAQVAGLPPGRITIALIHQLMKKFFGKEYERFPDLRIIEWTKKVRGHTDGLNNRSSNSFLQTWRVDSSFPAQLNKSGNSQQTFKLSFADLEQREIQQLHVLFVASPKTHYFCNRRESFQTGRRCWYGFKFRSSEHLLKTFLHVIRRTLAHLIMQQKCKNESNFLNFFAYPALIALFLWDTMFCIHPNNSNTFKWGLASDPGPPLRFSFGPRREKSFDTPALYFTK